VPAKYTGYNADPQYVRGDVQAIYEELKK
jgi:hypothetical protein